MAGRNSSRPLTANTASSPARCRPTRCRRRAWRRRRPGHCEDCACRRAADATRSSPTGVTSSNSTGSAVHGPTASTAARAEVGRRSTPKVDDTARARELPPVAAYRIVGVDDGDAVGGKPREQLALPRRHAVQRSEPFEVGGDPRWSRCRRSARRSTRDAQSRRGGWRPSRSTAVRCDASQRSSVSGTPMWLFRFPFVTRPAPRG